MGPPSPASPSGQQHITKDRPSCKATLRSIPRARRRGAEPRARRWCQFPSLDTRHKGRWERDVGTGHSVPLWGLATWGGLSTGSPPSLTILGASTGHHRVSRRYEAWHALGRTPHPSLTHGKAGEGGPTAEGQGLRPGEVRAGRLQSPPENAGSQLAAHRPRSAGSRKVCVSFNINSQAFNIPRSLNTETFSLPDCAFCSAKHNLASSPSPKASICSCLQDVMIYAVLPLGLVRLIETRGRREATELEVQVGPVPRGPGIWILGRGARTHGAHSRGLPWRPFLTLPFHGRQWPRKHGCHLLGWISPGAERAGPEPLPCLSLWPAQGCGDGAATPYPCRKSVLNL